MEQKEIKIINTYSDAQKRANKKYRENNKDKVNEQRKKYYLKRKESDPKFLEYKRLKAKEYYQKKKISKKQPDKLEVILEENVEEKPLVIPLLEEKPLVIPLPEKKEKRKYVKKIKTA